MASPAHCAYCFEILTADLEDREPLSYRQVLDLWAQYTALTDPKAIGPSDSSEEAHDQDGGDDLAEEDSEMDGVEETDGEEEEEEEEEEGNDNEPPEELAQPVPTKLSLPSISRLQAPSPASASSSSSTPSSLSTTSSNVALDSASKSSSKTSFFSFGSRRSQQPSPAAPPKESSEEEEYPLFVTWNTISPRSGHKSLRGCIGTFEAQSLGAGLRGYSITAQVTSLPSISLKPTPPPPTSPPKTAVYTPHQTNQANPSTPSAYSDHRFPPITISELPTLSVSITLLAHFTPAAHPLDWTLGTHGIRISFTHHSKRYNATYLPDVAVEQGWSKEETIVSLMRKAGWKGRSGEWRAVKGMGVVRYEGKKASLGWGEFRGWRGWVDGLRE